MAKAKKKKPRLTNTLKPKMQVEGPFVCTTCAADFSVTFKPGITPVTTKCCPSCGNAIVAKPATAI